MHYNDNPDTLYNDYAFMELCRTVAITTGETDMDKIGEMTPDEILLASESFYRKRELAMFDIHMQAYLNQVVKSVDKNDKPVYDKFEKFYNQEKSVERITNEFDSKYSTGSYIRKRNRKSTPVIEAPHVVDDSRKKKLAETARLDAINRKNLEGSKLGAILGLSSNQDK